MRPYLLGFFAFTLILADASAYEGVLITDNGEGYGFHGGCSGWNGCGDAKTCALWACQINGYPGVISYGRTDPCINYNVCHLFYSKTRIEWNWGNWCSIMGVSEIYCEPICKDEDGDGYNAKGDDCGPVDCNDKDAKIHPGAKESCNGADDDCDGQTDDNLIDTCGTGLCQGTTTCSGGSWSECSSYGVDAGICSICSDEGKVEYDPSQTDDCGQTLCPADGCGLGGCGQNIFTEYPYAVDNECEAIGRCTENTCDDLAVCESDGDGDGYSPSCGDCDDSRDTVYPGAVETCDGEDEDCDGLYDEGIVESCGEGNCIGLRICDIGSWSDCSSYEQDAGVCALCDSDGIPEFDSSQESDCAPTICEQDGCDADGCGMFIFGDYPDSVDNECLDLFECTDNICDGLALCEDDGDGDDYSASCGDCMDDDPLVSPEGMEIPGNSIDEDCDSEFLCDPAMTRTTALSEYDNINECVVSEAKKLKDEGLISGREYGEIISDFHSSDKGKKK